MRKNTLEKLSANPHYRLTAQQEAELEDYRIADRRLKRVKHTTKVKLHKDNVAKHQTYLKNE